MPTGPTRRRAQTVSEENEVYEDEVLGALAVVAKEDLSSGEIRVSWKTYGTAPGGFMTPARSPSSPSSGGSSTIRPTLGRSGSSSASTGTPWTT